MKYDDIVRMSREVYVFGARENWRFKALPIITFEFSTLGDFARAKMEMLQCTRAMLFMFDEKSQTRMFQDDTFEMDIHGVTVRLVCTQIMMTPQGPIGAGSVR